MKVSPYVISFGCLIGPLLSNSQWPVFCTTFSGLWASNKILYSARDSFGRGWNSVSLVKWLWCRSLQGLSQSNLFPVSNFNIIIWNHCNGVFHIENFLPQSRLDHLGALGVPLWITEFDNKDGDLGKRAKVYADALRLYYSHPSVKGIIIWDGSTLHDGDFKVNMW